MKFLKRFFDIILSFISLIILIPLFIVLSISVKVDSKGPIFFRQKRLTKDGKVFTMYKFRSMLVNSEKTGAGLFNYENDPRVTKMGRFLRDSSLDELPQLWNILKGDMSIVGPRPPVTYELGPYENLSVSYKNRFNVKAGITGLAQVSGRNELEWDEKVVYDNKYIDLFNKYGIFFDIKLIALTVVKVFSSRDIYERKDENTENLSSEEIAKIAAEKVARLASLEKEK